MGIVTISETELKPVSLRKTSAATATALSATSIHVQAWSITAETDNTGIVAVGDSSVDPTAGSQQGLLLRAGDSYVGATRVDLKDVYINSEVSGDGVSVLYWL